MKQIILHALLYPWLAMVRLFTVHIPWFKSNMNQYKMGGQKSGLRSHETIRNE